MPQSWGGLSQAQRPSMSATNRINRFRLATPSMRDSFEWIVVTVTTRSSIRRRLRFRRPRHASTVIALPTMQERRHSRRFIRRARSLSHCMRVGTPAAVWLGNVFTICRSLCFSIIRPTSTRVSVVSRATAGSTRWKRFISMRSYRWLGASNVIAILILIFEMSKTLPSSTGSPQKIGTKKSLRKKFAKKRTLTPRHIVRFVTARRPKRYRSSPFTVTNHRICTI